MIAWWSHQPRIFSSSHKRWCTGHSLVIRYTTTTPSTRITMGNFSMMKKKTKNSKLKRKRERTKRKSKRESKRKPKIPSNTSPTCPTLNLLWTTSRRRSTSLIRTLKKWRKPWTPTLMMNLKCSNPSSWRAPSPWKSADPMSHPHGSSRSGKSSQNNQKRDSTALGGMRHAKWGSPYPAAAAKRN